MQQTIKELFDEPSGLKELVEDETPKEKPQQQQQQQQPTRESRRRHDRKKDKGKEEEKGEEEKPADTSMSQEQIEQVMMIVVKIFMCNGKNVCVKGGCKFYM